jgi:hypothetical protein
MATESSAVVRFINLVQKDHAPIYSEGLRETAVDLRPRAGKGAKVAFGAVVIAGAAITGGFLLGRGHFGASSSSASSSLSPSSMSSTPAAVTPSAAPAPAPAPTPIPAPAVAPIVSVPPDLLAETGFDIRVTPPGNVSVDAQLLGTAPLRIRSLSPGKHVIDIQAPAGYFSRRVDVDLVAGEPQELKLSLDPIEDSAVVADEAPAEAAKTEVAPSRRESGKDRKARKAEARRAAREAKLAAVAEAKRVARERAELKREAARDEKERRERETAAKPAAEDDLDAAMASVTGEKKGAAPKVAALAPSSDGAASGEPGTLMLGSKPLCDIYIDGRDTGLKTPQRSMELAPGTYKIKLVNTELGIDRSFKVKIAPGKTTRAIQDLTKN